MTVRHATVLMVFLAACAPAAEDAPTADGPQVATYTATDFEFSGPDTLAPGFTTVRLINKGAQDHHLMLARLDEGKSMQDIAAAMQADMNAEPPWLKFVGGAGAIGPNGSSAGISDLAPGNYIMFCFVTDPADGTSHIAKGMMKEVVVTGERLPAEAPIVAGEIQLNDFGFETPTLTAGTHTFRVVNVGLQTHEITLVRLNDGVTQEQFMASMAPGATPGPPPGVLVGGNGAISAGLSNFWTVDLTPGTYLMLCFVPDPADGAPHVMKGMVKEIVITAS